MKLSTETLNVLKNFASINQGIQFKKGKELKILLNWTLIPQMLFSNLVVRKWLIVKPINQ